MKLIEKFNYETVINDVNVSEEMKVVLDERRATLKKGKFCSLGRGEKSKFVWKLRNEL